MLKAGKARWLIPGLVTGFVILLVAGIALLGAYIYLSRRSNAEVGWINPVDAVHGQSVAPDLAALSLAGEPDERVFKAALDAGEKETAYATLAYSLLMPDNMRGGHWLLLSPYCRSLGGARADICYQVPLDLASLSPTLNDAARADLSLQAARGYLEMGKPAAARLALAQVENIARFSLGLLPAQRRAVLGQLVDVYRAMGDNSAAAAVQSDSGTAGPGMTTEPSPLLLPGLRGSVVLPAQVTAAIVTRQQAAAELSAGWFSADQNRRLEMAAKLGRALLAEDEARASFYSASVDLSPSDRLALLHDQVAWLLTKYRAARGDFGVSLVPEWETGVQEIRDSLAEAYTQLVNVYGRQLDTLSSADATQARVELLRQGVLWSRLGLFPARAEEALSEQLAEASRQLWTRQGNAGLTIIVQNVDGKRFYLLSGSAGSRSSARGRRDFVG